MPQRIPDHKRSQDRKPEGIARIYSVRTHSLPISVPALQDFVISVDSRLLCVSRFACLIGSFILSLIHHYIVEQTTLWFIGDKP